MSLTALTSFSVRQMFELTKPVLSIVFIGKIYMRDEVWRDCAKKFESSTFVLLLAHRA
jgi:hypothetical protein